jgi:release factor glutamine methyltransferase
MGTVEYRGIVLTIPHEGREPLVYRPREDSELLAENLEVKEGEEVLELGAGSGLLSIIAAKKGGKVTATDINPHAVEAAKENAKRNKVEIEVLEGDLFEPVRGRKFDLIIFNAPYLPPSPEEPFPLRPVDYSYHSSDVMKRFAKQYKKFLKPGGRALITNSELSRVELEGKVIAKQRVGEDQFEEEIFVVEMR